MIKKIRSFIGCIPPFLLAVCLWWAIAGCAPTMIDVEGHKIFNPDYLFYLESGSRDRWQKPDEVIKALDIPKSATIADIGAGGGYFTEKFSRYLDTPGRVYATDVQQIMIEKLQQRVVKQKLDNVEVIRGAFDNPSLPSNCCDLVFFSSVYKEINGRTAYMEKIIPALKSGGRVAIIEFRPDNMSPGPPPDIRLSPKQVIEELDAAGFRLVKKFEFLPREYFLIFSIANS